ncbi:AraC family transcriptional regulator [Burkholderia sp. BCC0322]|uniref:AraC family transcriptional regulator n=1 Tax=Burkholderia sp. BCC0322 TaxID=2676296 RepID=UPI001FC8DF21|nr:AraC family transcriptional regulator [Burkholderia sp. BCC0322]
MHIFSPERGNAATPAGALPTYPHVDDLAVQIQMGSSTFDHHFRQLTGKSPLRYQKWIRLNEARRLMLPERLDAA